MSIPMNKLLMNIRQLVTPVGSRPLPGTRMSEIAVQRDVNVLVRGERIAEILPRSAPAPAVDEVIDARGGIVLPGLVDPLVEVGGGSKAWRTVGGTGDPRDASRERDEAIRHRVASSLRQMLRSGTTSLEARAPHNALLDVAEALEAVRAAAAELGLRPGTCVCGAPRQTSRGAADDRISSMIGDTIPTLRRRQLAACCSVVCGDGGYERKEARAILRAARGAGMDLRVSASGSGVEAVMLAVEMDVQSIDRLLSPRRSELEQLRRADVCPVVVPSLSMQEDRPWPDARAMINAGLALALGSGADLLGSGVHSMFTVIALAARRMGLSLDEAITAATANAAAAVGMTHEVGSIEPGKKANLVILDVDDYRDLREILVGVPIRAVLVDGRELVGG
jgi:imidazolonepropionase